MLFRSSEDNLPVHPHPKPFILVPGLQPSSSYKNQILIFRALNKHLSEHRLELILTGKNAEMNLRSYEPYNLLPNISIKYFTERDLLWHYRNALAVVYPSKEEGFGLPIIESQAAGTLAITCSNSSLREVGGNHAVYIEPDNELQLSEVIDYLLIKNDKLFAQPQWKQRLSLNAD